MKRAILILFLIAGITLAKDVAYSSELKVTLAPEVSVGTSQPVTIGDIAKIYAPAEIATKIASIVATGAPQPGSKRTIEADYVKFKLSAAGLNAVKVTGAAKVALTGRCRRISPQTLETLVRDYITGLLPKTDLTYEIEVERSPKELITPDDPTIEIKPRLFGATIHAGVNTIAIDALQAGRSIRTTSVVTRIKSIASVVIAAQTISQGQAISDKNTKIESRDITKLNDPIWASNDNSQCFVARRSILAGQIITTSDVAVAPDIRSGDQVTLTVRCGTVAIRTNAEAKQNGRVGETIKVISGISKEEFRARITAPGMVEVSR